MLPATIRIVAGATILWVIVAGNDEYVKTTLGSLEGRERISRDGRPYAAWTKIPFAQPPVGPYRFAPPVPVNKWDGVLKATEPVPKCAQANKLIGKDFDGQEDCLYLSVYRPKIENKSLPVLFYVHGGAFIFGHPGTPEMADFLMDEDVILVTTTYRLGPFGFSSLSDQELPGNMGMKDQALALRWVYDHIEAFGGNPQAITVFGESAGAASAHYLAISPATRDLVKAAVATSGVVNKVWSRIDPLLVKDVTKKLAAQLNCSRDTSGEIVECLRNIEDPSKIIVAAELVKPEGVDIPFGPTIEPAGPGAFATEDLSEVESTKPMIISFSAGEHLLFELPIKMQGGGKVKNAARDLDAFARNLLKHYFKDDDKLKAAAAQVKERYLMKHDKDSIPELIHDVSMIYQDVDFIYPAMRTAENHKGPLWMYQFVHRGEISLFDFVFRINTTVANHADEILYFFNQRSKYKTLKDDPEPNDVRVSKEMVRFLANFATYNTPTAQGSSTGWEPYKGGEILQVKTESSEMADKAFVREQKDIMQFWQNIFDSAAHSIKEEL